jgi:hypothetical protein
MTSPSWRPKLPAPSAGRRALAAAIERCERRRVEKEEAAEERLLRELLGRDRARRSLRRDQED